MKIKYCGLTNIEDVVEAVSLKVDYLGFIVEIPASPRSLNLKNFLDLNVSLKKIMSRDLQAQFADTKIVLVTSCPELGTLNKLLNLAKIDIIQIHDKLEPSLYTYLSNIHFSKSLKHIKIWRALPISQEDSYQQTYQKIQECRQIADRFVLDIPKTKDTAQAGLAFNRLDIFKKLKKQGFELVLAGGLNAQNLEYYIQQLAPEIVDLCSSIESYPGKKSFQKMKNFIDLASRFNQPAFL